jgi:hypothetical protein
VLETRSLSLAEMKRHTTVGGGSLLAWRFAFSVLGDQHTRCMTCGPGPPCHRLGCLGARQARFSVASRGASERVFLEKGFTPRVAVTLSHSLPISAPFRLRALSTLSHLRSPAFGRRSHHGLANPSRALPVGGGTQPGAQPARMGRAGVRRKDPCWHLSPRRSRHRGVRALRLLPLMRVGTADPAFLPAAARGAWPPTSALHAPLHPPGGHLRPPLRDVRGGGASSASAQTKGCCAATFQRKRVELRLHLRVNFTSISWYVSMNWSSSSSVFSGQAAECRALSCLHLFSFNGLDVASNDEGSFTLTHASRRPPPLASCSTGLPLALLFPMETPWRRRPRAFSATLLMSSSSYL